MSLPALRDRLQHLQYHAPIHAAHLSADRGTPEERLGFAMEATSDGSPLATALRLFTIGVPVHNADAESALPHLLPALLSRGLLRADPDRVWSTRAITFVNATAVAQDFIPWRRDDQQHDFVTPVAGATRILSMFTVLPPTKAARALEVGTGQGYPITLVSAYTREAVGTDISPRSLECAAMTAELNDRPNISFRLGSLFEPAGDEPFDTILSNPPFVISTPSATEQYSTLAQASLTEQLVRESPHHLREGGFATILANWAHGTDWTTPVQRWVEGNGCDSLVIQIRSESPRAYAHAWRREMRLLHPFRDPTPLDTWLSIFEKTQAVSFGAIILRRRTGTNWFHSFSRSTAGLQAGTGNQLRRLFDARLRLESAATPQDLLNVAPQVCPAIELSGRPVPMAARSGPAARARHTEYGLSRGTLRQTEGWPEPITVDPAALSVLLSCDGKKPLRTIIESVAAGTGSSAAAMERLMTGIVPRWFDAGYLF